MVKMPTTFWLCITTAEPPLLKKCPNAARDEPQIGPDDQAVCWSGSRQERNELDEPNGTADLERGNELLIGGRTPTEGQVCEQRKRQEPEQVLDDGVDGASHEVASLSR